jgi:hypothetical protein
MFLGKFAALDVFEYNGIFLESVETDGKFSDQVRDMIAPQSAILCSTALGGNMNYGAVSITEDRAITIYAARRVPQSWPDKNNGLWRQRVSSRFCPVRERFRVMANLFDRARRRNSHRQRRTRAPGRQARQEVTVAGH